MVKVIKPRVYEISNSTVESTADVYQTHQAGELKKHIANEFNNQTTGNSLEMNATSDVFESMKAVHDNADIAGCAKAVTYVRDLVISQ